MSMGDDLVAVPGFHQPALRSFKGREIGNKDRSLGSFGQLTLRPLSEDDTDQSSLGNRTRGLTSALALGEKSTRRTKAVETANSLCSRMAVKAI